MLRHTEVGLAELGKESNLMIDIPTVRYLENEVKILSPLV